LDLGKGSNGLKEERTGVEQIRLEGVEYFGQFRNKIIFYPIIEGAYANTKNWYRERLTCEPTLAEEYHSVGDFLQSIQ
jgi:hypothetical protein